MKLAQDSCTRVGRLNEAVDNLWRLDRIYINVSAGVLMDLASSVGVIGQLGNDYNASDHLPVGAAIWPGSIVCDMARRNSFLNGSGSMKGLASMLRSLVKRRHGQKIDGAN